MEAFDHECTVPIYDVNWSILRGPPIVPSLQHLRNLRHKHGYKETNGLFAECPHCQHSWTYEEMVDCYVRKVGGINDIVTPDDETIIREGANIPKARIMATIVQYQRTRGVRIEETPVMAINVGYNCHVSSHVPGCFKCNKLSKAARKKHRCNEECECRFRLPDCSRRKSCYRSVTEQNDWFTFDGTKIWRPFIQLVPKRLPLNLFQNVSCPAISETKLACNTNIGVVTDGPIAMYQMKYQHKKNRKEETSNYEEVQAQIRAIESGGRKYDDDKKEASRVLIRSSFAHNSANIIGPIMASYLTRNGSRFYFSHEFVYTPLNDVIRLLLNQCVTGKATLSDGNLYFENKALDYLCLDPSLEGLNLRQFYEQYETANGKKKGQTFLRFQCDTGHFKHPSANRGGTRCSKGSVPCDKELLIKVPQWLFPDNRKLP